MLLNLELPQLSVETDCDCHLNVETERIRNMGIKNISVIHWNKQKGYIKTALAFKRLNYKASVKTELTIMQWCGFSKTSAQKGSPGNRLQKLKAGRLPTGLLLENALKILPTFHCCF
jgi:hypothetical protein